MARIVIYQAGAWHDFQPYKDRWLGEAPGKVIIPDGEDKDRVTGAFPEINIKDLLTIPELIEGYIKNRREKGLLSRHSVESILSAIMGESDASYLKIEKYKQSYVKVLTDFIYNFRTTSLVDLQTAIAGFKTERFTLREKDLVKIYAEYENKLPDYGFDLRSGLEELLRHAGEGDTRRLLSLGENERVIFLGFNYITPLEEECIVTVSLYAARVSFLYCADEAVAEQATRVQKSVTAVLKRLEGQGARYENLSPAAGDYFADLSRSVFQPQPPGAKVDVRTDKSYDVPVPRDAITVSEANSRYLEVVSIARRIKRLAANGVSLREIRVVAPAYHLYGSIIREVFPEYEIPFSLEKGAPLLQFPLAAIINHLVNQSTSANAYPLREKIFSSPYVSFASKVKPSDLVGFQESGGGELFSGEIPARLINADLSYRLDFSFIKDLRDKAYRTVKPASGTPPLEIVKRYLDGLTWASAAAKEEFSCRCLIQLYLLARAEKKLSAWQTRMSGAAFAEALRELLSRFHIATNSKLSDDIARDPLAVRIRERDAVIIRRVDKLLSEMLSFLAPMDKSPGDKFALVELVRVFSRLMSEATLSRKDLSPPEEAGGVAIQAVDRGQLQGWDYTFICGLVDGEFPAKEEFNFLQPKKEGLGLGRAYTSVDYGRNRFYHLVRSTAKGLFLSRPLSDQGRRLPPSPFIKEIQKCAGPKMMPADCGQPDADREQVYSRREKLFLIGKNVDHDYDKAVPLLNELKHEDEAFFNKITDTLRFDGLTLSAASFSEFDGIFPVLHPAPTNLCGGSATPPLALLSDKVKAIVFTPAILERYAACPMRFFLDDIMGLKPEPDYHPDTVETGLLIRSLLKEYTAGAVAAQGVPRDAPVLLYKLVNDYRQEQEQSGADAFQLRFLHRLAAGLVSPQIKSGEISDNNAIRRPGLLRAFLNYEENGPDYLQPYGAALAGMVALDDKLAIRVELDRADMTAGGKYLIAFLYTTAQAGDPKRIIRGLRFDLPLAVLLCADHASEKQVYIPVAGAGLYLVKTPKGIRRGGYFAIDEIRASRRENTSPEVPIFSGQREGFMPREDFAAALEKIKEHILRLYRLMKSGVFHLPLCLEAEQTCDNCSFGRVCRKEQLRLERLKLHYRYAGADKVNLVREIFD